MLMNRTLAIIRYTVIAALAATSLFSSAQSTGNNSKALEARVNGLIAEMTLDEKIELISGDTPFRTHPIPRLNIPYFPVSYTHLRAHETDSYLVCRLLLETK